MAAPEILHDPVQQHTISLYVNNKPGVLVRVSLVFARRGYNIDSLVVSPAAQGEFSRITITCTGDKPTLEQIILQLAKLVDVVLQIAEHFGAKVVDYGPDSLTLRSYGSSDKLDAFIELLRPYGLLELVRSGKIVMARGLRDT